jgi:hypothetical protein
MVAASGIDQEKQMRRVVPLAAVVAIAGAAAVAQAAPSPTLTAQVSPKPVLLTHAATVKGHLSTGKGNVTVVLETLRYPFSGSFQKAATTKTGAGGDYVFHFKPRLATRVRVRLANNPAVHSSTSTAYVIGDFSHRTCRITPNAPNQSCASPRGSGQLTVHLSYHRNYPASAYATEAAKSVFVYFGIRNGTQPPQTLTLRKTVQQKGIGNDTTSVSASYSFQAPSGKWTYQIATCIKFTEAVDGLGLPTSHHCGDQSVSHQQASNSNTFG